MAVETLARTLEEVRTLSDEDKARLREEIDHLLGDEERRRKEEELVRRLQSEGLAVENPNEHP